AAARRRRGGPRGRDGGARGGLRCRARPARRARAARGGHRLAGPVRPRRGGLAVPGLRARAAFARGRPSRGGGGRRRDGASRAPSALSTPSARSRSGGVHGAIPWLYSGRMEVSVSKLRAELKDWIDAARRGDEVV